MPPFFSFLPSDVLRSFTEYIVALPLKSQLKNIRNYLKAFEFAMTLKDIQPAVSICLFSTWLLSDTQQYMFIDIHDQYQSSKTGGALE